MVTVEVAFDVPKIFWEYIAEVLVDIKHCFNISLFNNESISFVTLFLLTLARFSLALAGSEKVARE